MSMLVILYKNKIKKEMGNLNIVGSVKSLPSFDEIMEWDNDKLKRVHYLLFDEAVYPGFGLTDSEREDERYEIDNYANAVHSVYVSRGFVYKSKVRIITLSNGKRVANFSSAHNFDFEDGSVLPAISDERAIELSLQLSEDVNERGDVRMEYDITREIEIEMDYWKRVHKLGEVDVVFCPYPMMEILWRNSRNNMFDDEKAEAYMESMPFRSVYRVSRVSKLVSITKQCL